MDGFVTMSKRDLAIMINTLKKLDVRGYDSMDMLVGMVAFLNNAIDGKQENIPEE